MKRTALISLVSFGFGCLLTYLMFYCCSGHRVIDSSLLATESSELSYKMALYKMLDERGEAEAREELFLSIQAQASADYLTNTRASKEAVDSYLKTVQEARQFLRQRKGVL